MSAAPELLRVAGLRVTYRGREEDVVALDGISLTLGRGETLGLLGESGSGKTTLALALLGVLPDNAEVDGEAWLDGVDLMALSENELRRVRWKQISMVFQGAASSLSPVFTIGEQMIDTLRAHMDIGRAEALERAGAMLEAVTLDTAVLRRYPHELSGGMAQRVAVATALLCSPSVVIADEPTASLDASTRRQVLRVLQEIQRSREASTIHISHDVAAVFQGSDRVAVLYAGKIVEEGPAKEIAAGPMHHYTALLAASVPRLRGPVGPLSMVSWSREAAPGTERLSPKRESGEGEPNLGIPREGCRFQPRCPAALEICRQQEPLLTAFGGRKVACWNPLKP